MSARWKVPCGFTAWISEQIGISANLCICEYTNINFSFLLKIVALILSQLIKFMQDFYLLRVVSQIQLAHFKFKSSKVLTSPGILSRRGCCLSSTNHIRTGSYPFAPFITNAQTKRTKPQWKRCVGPAKRAEPSCLPWLFCYFFCQEKKYSKIITGANSVQKVSFFRNQKNLCTSNNKKPRIAGLYYNLVYQCCLVPAVRTVVSVIPVVMLVSFAEFGIHHPDLLLALLL